MSSCTMELKHCITSAFVFDLNYNMYKLKNVFLSLKMLYLKHSTYVKEIYLGHHLLT